MRAPIARKSGAPPPRICVLQGYDRSRVDKLHLKGIDVRAHAASQQPGRQPAVAPESERDAQPRARLFALTLVSALGASELLTLAYVLGVYASGGGSGGGFGAGGGGGGGGGSGGFFDRLLPAAHAADANDDDDEDEEELDDEELDDDADFEEESEAVEGGEVDGSVATDDEDGDADGDDDDDDEAEREYIRVPAGLDPTSFYCSEMQAVGLPKGKGCPTKESLLDGLNCQVGFWVSKKKLQQDVRALRKTGIFAAVDVKVIPYKKSSKSKRMRAIFTFSEKFHPQIQSIKIKSKVLPRTVAADVMHKLRKTFPDQVTGIAVMSFVRDEIEKHYRDMGFSLSHVKHYNGIDSGKIEVVTNEPRVSRVTVQFVDDNFQEKTTPPSISKAAVLKHISMREGDFYALSDGRTALQEAFTLGAFENAQVLPEQKGNRDGNELYQLTLMLKEKPVRTYDSELEWALGQVHRKLPLPFPSHVVPGGYMMYEDRDLRGKGDSITASVHCSSFLHPADDLQLSVKYKRPGPFMPKDVRRAAVQTKDFAGKPNLVLDAFNSRRLSSVFTGVGPQAQAVPPVWIERAGLKSQIEHKLTRNSVSYGGLVTQQIKTRDDTNALVQHGMRMTQNGEPVEGGPPTTLSGTGCDRSIHAQFGMLRDTTWSSDGALVGARDVLEVNQGLGLGNGVFNRYLLSLTRFKRLWSPPAKWKLGPVTAVAHAAHGNCIGPHASYEWHVLGGPTSSRAFSIGELGAARRWLETAAELRAVLPVGNARTQVYGYIEDARALEGTDALAGRPRAYLTRPGQGSTTGAGIKLGAMRLEWAKDCNKGAGTWFVFFGDRF